MIKKYKDELEALKLKMEQAEAFSLVVPFFKENIIDEKITGLEEWKEYGRFFKNTELSWGLNRGHYISDTSRRITNFHLEHDVYCWNVYINTLSLYDSHAKYGLNEIADNVDVYFYDSLNSTFYFTDEQFDSVMDAINEWYIKAQAQHTEDSKAERDRKLQEEKALLEKKIAELS